MRSSLPQARALHSFKETKREHSHYKQLSCLLHYRADGNETEFKDMSSLCENCSIWLNLTRTKEMSNVYINNY